MKKQLPLRRHGIVTLRLLAAISAATAVLALVGTSAASAAPYPVTSIMIYDGTHANPVGPPGPLSSKWTVYPDPATITTTNYGTLVEDTSLQCCGDNPAGEWWYNTGGMILHAFYWDNNGTRAEEYSLQPLAWSYPGNGLAEPTCLTWNNPNGQQFFAVLNSTRKTWSKANSSCGAV